MNNTHKFAELDKLVGGLKQVTGLPEKERNKTPQHKIASIIKDYVTELSKGLKK